MADRILFRRGYKYQLNQDYVLTLPKAFEPAHDIETPFIRLASPNREAHPEESAPVLTVRYGYAWDGASGPTRDTKSAMRGSLVHDALYQLMRMRLLPLRLREPTDHLFWEIIREDGMNRMRAFFWWRAVRRFAEKGATNEDRPVEAAP